MEMKRLITFFIVAVLAVSVYAETKDGEAGDSLPFLHPKMVFEMVERNIHPKVVLDRVERTVKGFTYIDENYVEPQHYNWTMMLQATRTYDIYTLRTTDQTNPQSVTFAPAANIKVGPYLGWRWIFMGYTLDLKNIGFGGKSPKQEWDFSIYSAQIGVDLFYRRTGSDYKIRNVRLGNAIDNNSLEGLAFSGLSVGITGFNLYYIFNHQKFSYPAAFSQSTCQKISCGSWMAGIGYTRNSLSFNHDELQRMATAYTGDPTLRLDSSLMFNSVKYYDLNFSVGYAYNWVFAKNCLACASLSAAVGYKRTKGETNNNVWDSFDPRNSLGFSDGNFSINNINLDGIGRFALVYNNTRWYAGASAIIHSYSYRKSRFATDNVFGSLNAYIGYNFGARGPYKKKR